LVWISIALYLQIMPTLCCGTIIRILDAILLRHSNLIGRRKDRRYPKQENGIDETAKSVTLFMIFNILNRP